MDRFLLKRTAPETDLAGTSRPVRLRQDHASNIGTTTTADINLDELPFDPANRKKEYHSTLRIQRSKMRSEEYI